MRSATPHLVPSLLAAILLLGLAACTDEVPDAGGAAPPDSAALVTRLGDDTLAVERWVRRDDRLEAVAAVRAPETTLRTYTVELASDGTMQSYEARLVPPTEPGAEPLRTETLERIDGGWKRTVADEDTTYTEELSAGADLLPFVDLVFWPYELALRRGTENLPREQPLQWGGRVMPFTVQRIGPQEVAVVHPFRGPSAVRVDASGRLLALDASETTRKVTVTREPWLDVAARARHWASQDEAGHGVGELSGRGSTEVSVGGATLTVDYGTPSKRGRDIFGNVVPWNDLWRTGANRATHFSTDQPLLLGDERTGTLEVPAGEYTLFSRPAPDGGQLIVNRETGQNGNAHDAAEDLGSVRMQREALSETVERFTIAVEPTGGQQGRLALRWDDSSFWVPFEVR